MHGALDEDTAIMNPIMPRRLTDLGSAPFGPLPPEFCTGPSLRPFMKAISQMPLPVAAGRKVGKAAADWPAAVAFAPRVPVIEPVIAIPTVSKNWRVKEKPVNGGIYFDHWPK